MGELNVGIMLSAGIDGAEPFGKGNFEEIKTDNKKYKNRQQKIRDKNNSLSVLRGNRECISSFWNK
jgi:hypothetical protein